MDLAKLAATLLAHGGSPRDYVGDDKIPGPISPLICVPTTAGTGSEVSAASVITDTEQQIKVGILSNYLRPAVAVVDPLLTVSCPPKVTADSGIDALTHAIEAYTAVDNAVFPLPAGERTVYQGKHPLGDSPRKRRFASSANTCAGRCVTATIWKRAMAWRWRRRWRGWRFPTSASRWSTRWNTPSAARSTARTAAATACCCPT